MAHAQNLREADLKGDRQLMRDVDDELIEPAVMERDAGTTFKITFAELQYKERG